MKLNKNKLLILGLILSFFSLSNGKESNLSKYVILVSFDGFRWDYLDRGITPTFNKLAEEGVKASSLKPCYPSMTFPNHYSIITGMYPQNHGIIANEFKNLISGEKFSRKLPDVKESKWYLGEAFWETARRNGIITATYFWAGSEMDLEYRRPNYYEPYNQNKDYSERVKSVLRWFDLPFERRPKFITLYFDGSDTYGHKFGTDSPQLNNSIKVLDSVLNKLVKGLELIKMRDSVDLILVSDHGMTNLSESRMIDIKNLISSKEVEIINYNTMAFINPKPNKIDEIYDELKSKEDHYTVYKKKEIPDRFNFNSGPLISEIVVMAENGWLLRNNNKWDSNYVGTHGYDNDNMDMHGILIAVGKDFKKGLKVDVLQNIDIYPLLCKIFGIDPRSNIDGKLERIEDILVNE